MSNKSHQEKIIALVLNLSVLIMELFGLYKSVIRYGFSMFQFYTIDSNLLALVASLLCSISLIKILQNKQEALPKQIHLLKYFSVCCLTVTFIVVVTVLAPVNGVNGYYIMLLQNEMLFHHFLCPILVFISFVFFEYKPRLEKKDTFLALIPTVIYAIIIVFLNIIKVIVGPYPFLRVYSQPLYMSIIWGIVILGGAYLIALLINYLNNRINKKHQ